MYISHIHVPAKGGSRKRRRARRRAIAEQHAALRKQERLDRCRKEARLQAIMRERLASSDKHNPRISLMQVLDYLQLEYHARRRIDALLDVLSETSPRLVDPDNALVFSRLISQPWIRPLRGWSPRGRSPRTHLISLVDHLLILYRVPAFIKSAFLSSEEADRNVVRVAPLLAHLGRGESIRSCVEADIIQMPLTRRMGHLFVTAPEGMSVLMALLRAQVLGHGGDEALARAVIGARISERHGSLRFWDEAIHWFCRQPDLDLVQVGPLTDYLEHRHRESSRFRLKGRTVRSLTRGMQSWHRELAVARLRGIIFLPSGLFGGTWRIKTSGEGRPDREIVWTMLEILNSKDLTSEGRILRHCVSSYTHKVASGSCAIWSLRCNEARCVTIEVSLQDRAVVQVRGKFNRPPRPQEMAMLRRWARTNHLIVDSVRLLWE